MKLVSIVALTGVALALAGCATTNTTGVRTTADVTAPAVTQPAARAGAYTLCDQQTSTGCSNKLTD